MATTQVTIKLPWDSIATVSADHTIHWYRGRKCGQVSVKEGEADKNNVVSSFNIPLNERPEVAVLESITSVKIPITTETNNDTTGMSGSSFEVSIEGTKYSIDVNGNITDNNFIRHLNNYKNQHGVFPNITFTVYSWIFAPSGGTATVYFIFDYPTIVGVSECSQKSYKPTADVDVGHDIQDGFDSIFSLLDESESDENGTCISSHGGVEGSEPDFTRTGESKTSIITIGSPFPRWTKLIQLRLYASIFIGNNISGTGSLYDGDASTVITIAAGGATTSFTQKLNSLLWDEAWVTNHYFLFEGIADSTLINAINQYYKLHDVMPKVDISLTTEAVGDFYYSADYENKTTTTTTDAKISQVYLEAVFQDIRLDIYKNRGGVWKQARAAYQKQEDAWIKISEDDCKNKLVAASLVTK